MAVTIAGLGAFLPPLKTNDAWSPELVASWPRRVPPRSLAPPDETGRLAWEGMAALAADPFQGCVSRPSAPPDMRTSDMEIAAARAAIADAGVASDAIDFVLQYSTGDDQLVPRNGFALHRALGLRRDLFIATVDADNMSFIAQLVLADGLLRSGVGHVGLLVQSTNRTQLADPRSPFSVLHGDGATAVVVRAGAAGGLFASVHRTASEGRDGYHFGALTGRWWQGGDIGFHIDDPPSVLAHFMATPGYLVGACQDVVARCALAMTDVDVLVCHQPAAWFQGVVQAAAGLGHARTVDTFRTHGSLGTCNLPLALAVAVRAGSVTAGDRILLCGGGAADTWSALCCRWGGA